MKKKLITAVLAVTMAVGMLTGCGSGTGTGKREASGEKLVIWTNMNVEVDTIQKYADEWGEKNGRKVEVIHQSPSVQQFAQAVKSASGPDAVVGIPNDQLADYVLSLIHISIDRILLSLNFRSMMNRRNFSVRHMKDWYAVYGRMKTNLL